jgi:hypothetical protein
MGDAHSGPDSKEDQEEEEGEAQQADEATPARLAPAGTAVGPPVPAPAGTGAVTERGEVWPRA